MQERLADAGVIASWSLFGLSFTQVNEVLQALAFMAAIVTSIAAARYYIRNTPRDD